MRVLATCFEPFGGDLLNSSCEAVMALPGHIDGIEICKAVIPTVFGESIDRLRKVIEDCEPDVVVCVGQAGKRDAITPERVAINVMDARIPDNKGVQPIDEPIVEGGPAAYFSTLPIKEMVREMKRAGLAAKVSNTAGTYVCNQLMYGLMHIIRTEHPEIRGGFIHVPRTTQQVVTTMGQHSMELNDIVNGLIVSIKILTN